ncbi:hypothetical protein NDI76_10265 [Halogeometricum sp. S1BR25-6]|uniref:Uncharacterized protein n=1 Tax=Halogeometricum salsisoli TaxID=2950536 RepID=A0ABU2GFQ8_9EURY|nr:hypothetical protein [Halogeometricum sp. S1BR25-6]MDS0299128.1 hypothetical protein [Halogeometricum sp. S1BR25-6]
MSTRRRFLAAFALATAGLAGCTDAPDVGTDDDDPGQVGGTPSPDRGTGRVGSETDTATDRETTTATTTDETTANGTGGATESRTSATSPQGELDLREANVVGVTVEAAGDGAYRFDVTLIHDDDGEDGYADRWVVEGLDGKELGRRELAHAHGTREFTRSTTVSVPRGVTCVVVRGHDRTHGYGGSVVLANVESGETVLLRQGTDPVANDRLAASCP